MSDLVIFNAEEAKKSIDLIGETYAEMNQQTIGYMAQLTERAEATGSNALTFMADAARKLAEFGQKPLALIEGAQSALSQYGEVVAEYEHNNTGLNLD